MEIKTASTSDLSRLLEFSDAAIRPRYIVFREPEYFHWQFIEPARLFGRQPPATYYLEDNGSMTAIAIGAQAPMFVGGTTKVGAWLHEFFALPGTVGHGSFLLRRFIDDFPFVGDAGHSLQAASTMGAIRRMCWFELNRLFAPIQPSVVFDLLVKKEPYTQAYLRQRFVPKPVAGASSQMLIQFDEEYDATWRESRKQFSVTTDRTSGYMNWRYCSHPFFSYDISRADVPSGPSYFVWRREPIVGLPTSEPIFALRLCEAIGSPQAIRSGFPAVFHQQMMTADNAFVDFFCSSGVVNAALKAAGLVEVIALPDFDLPRLFCPLADDMRKRINFAYVSNDDHTIGFFDHTNAYFTKGDSNQDRPNL